MTKEDSHPDALILLTIHSHSGKIIAAITLGTRFAASPANSGCANGRSAGVCRVRKVVKGEVVGNYRMSGGRALASLLVVAVFSFAAGKAAPAYAVGGPVPDGTSIWYGVYIDGSVVDDSSTLVPSSGSFADGSGDMASPQWTTNASDSTSIGSILSGAGIAVSASLTPGSVNAMMAAGAIQGPATGLELTAEGDVIMWDTLVIAAAGLGERNSHAQWHVYNVGNHQRDCADGRRLLCPRQPKSFLRNKLSITQQRYDWRVN